MTGAACRKYHDAEPKLYDQVLYHWKDKGWLDAIQLRRQGPAQSEMVWYFRERGPRGTIRLR